MLFYAGTRRPCSKKSAHVIASFRSDVISGGAFIADGIRCQSNWNARFSYRQHCLVLALKPRVYFVYMKPHTKPARCYAGTILKYDLLKLPSITKRFTDAPWTGNESGSCRQNCYGRLWWLQQQSLLELSWAQVALLTFCSLVRLDSNSTKED